MIEIDKYSWQIRKMLAIMFGHGKAHHWGGSMSCAEIVASVYFYKMNYNKDNYQSSDRDRFIMSKGHCVPTQYAALAMKGILDMDELKTIKTLGSRLQGHPDMRKTPGIEVGTGSLGQGLSVANGMALAARMNNQSFNIFVVCGDGELQEGQIWEAAMTSSHYKLANVCLIVDCNKYESQGCVDSSMNISPLHDKFKSFGWRSIEVNGHDTDEICKALDMIENDTEKPLVIIAETIKAKGVTSLENSHVGHNFALVEDELKNTHKHIDIRLQELEVSL